MAVSRKQSTFKKDEIRKLLDCIDRDNVLLIKKTDAITNSMKEEAWKKLEVAYNAGATRGTVLRNIGSLKLKWDNIKKSARRRCAEIRMNALKTGGNKLFIMPDDILDRVISMIGEASGAGYVNKIGSSDRDHFTPNISIPEYVELSGCSAVKTEGVIVPKHQEKHDTSIQHGRTLDINLKKALRNPPREKTPPQPTPTSHIPSSKPQPGFVSRTQSSKPQPGPSLAEPIPTLLRTHTLPVLRDGPGHRTKRMSPLEASAVRRNESMAMCYTERAEYYKAKRRALETRHFNQDYNDELKIFKSEII